MVRRLHRAVVSVVLGSLGVLLAGCSDPPPPEAPLGVFVLDKAAMVRAQVEQGIPEAAAREHAQRLRLQADLRADATFEVLQRLGDEPLAVFTGTWTRAGAELTLTTTHEGGQPLPTPYATIATLSGDLLVIRMTTGLGDPLVLSRK